MDAQTGEKKQMIGVACISFLSSELFGLGVEQSDEMYVFLIDNTGKKTSQQSCNLFMSLVQYQSRGIIFRTLSRFGFLTYVNVSLYHLMIIQLGNVSKQVCKRLTGNDR